jgi:hypothetical protein
LSSNVGDNASTKEILGKNKGVVLIASLYTSMEDLIFNLYSFTEQTHYHFLNAVSDNFKSCRRRAFKIYVAKKCFKI